MHERAGEIPRPFLFDLWLRSRGVLSHRTSATLQGLLDERTTIEVSTTGFLRAPHSQVRVHRVTQLENHDLRYLDDMRITNPVRTVVDLAGVFRL
ncbi:hypothetical protein BH20ACT23_BH20ACT23_06760 [soil metagenome]